MSAPRHRSVPALAKKATIARDFFHKPAVVQGRCDLKPTFLSLGSVEVAGSYTFHRHQHLDYEVIVIDHGRYRCLINDVEIILRRNQLLVVKPGDWHEDLLSPPLRYLGLTFRLDSTSVGPAPTLFAPGIDVRAQVMDDSRRELWPLLERLSQENVIGDAMSAHLQDAVLDEFFWLLVRGFGDRVVAPALFQRIDSEHFSERLHNLFRSRVSSSLSMTEMAQAMNLSASSLSSRCREHLACAPAQAFRRFKMNHAQSLLRGTDMSVKEVSQHLGFENQYHFSKVFKSQHHVPPSRARGR